MHGGVLLRFIGQPEQAEVAPRVHVPKGLAMLCAEPHCEAIYAADGGPCPACGSSQGFPIARWLDREKGGAK